MIKTERQFQSAQRAAAAFAASLAARPAAPPEGADIHPRFWAAEADAMAAQLEELEDAIRHYDDLRSGARRIIALAGWADVPRALIEGRIAARLSQKELAERLGLPEQAVQRYEASDYASASLARLQEVAGAIGVSLSGLAAVPPAEPTPGRFKERLRELGLSNAWVAERLLPGPVAAAIFGPAERPPAERPPGERASAERGAGGRGSADRGQPVATALVQAADVLRRVFDIDPAFLFGPGDLALAPAVVGQTRFKRPARPPAKGTRAYTFYAKYLAVVSLQACDGIARRPLPSTAAEVRRAVRERFGALTLEHLLRYVWAHGVPVLPLRDAGAFHGACWRIGGREVIALKQRTPSEDRLAFDLSHEIGHIADEPPGDEFEILEEEVPPADDPREQRAMAFAADVLLGGEADALAERAMARVDDDVRRLARAVPAVAREADVPAGVLANHLAFRIAQDSDGKINWWGSAAKLQAADGDPWRIARDVFLECADLGRVNPADRDLLTRALEDPGPVAAGAAGA